MNIYVAGKIGNDLRGVQAFMEKLRAKGHEVTHDWTTDTPVRRPYLDHPGVNVAAANKMAWGADTADAFVLLYHPSLLGALIECGIAMGSWLSQPEKRIYIVGLNPRQSIFYTLSCVTMCDSKAQVLEYF